ncbi:MAG: UDP-N-acetylmuramate dehydrogenase [Candidatus Promineifilaceae bacterium]
MIKNDMSWIATDTVTDHFKAAFGEAFKLNQPLAKYSTARVGGNAELFVKVKSAEQLQKAVELAIENNLPYFVMGGGSNILVADEGVSGLVILNRARKISFHNSGFRIICRAESGVNISSLARQCVAKGLGGLEWAVSVPGTIGGATVNNSGAHGADMNSNLVSAMVWEPGVGVRVMSNSDMAYAYRNSTLKREHGSGKPNRVVLSVDLELKPETVRVLDARAEAFITHRKQTQPGGATMGSMFKNPEHYYAGYLIEAAGMKGQRIGGVEVSEKHANFFINSEKASAEDIRALLAEVFNQVREQFNVELEPEVELVGDWAFDFGSTTLPDEDEAEN